MDLGLKPFHKKKSMQFALKVCATAIFPYARCWFSCEHILCVKAWEAFTNTTTFSGEAATHDNNPMFGEHPVASMWLPIGTFFYRFQDFLEVEMEQSDSYSFHQACQSCFSYSKWRKRTCSRPRRTPNSSEKRQGFWGVWVVLGLASIGHVDLTCQHVQSDVWEACREELLKLEVVITNPVDLSTCTYLRLLVTDM